MIVLYVLAFIFILSPFLPAFPNPHWFFRTADFIRIQSLIIQLVLLVLVASLVDEFDIFAVCILAGLLISALYQFAKIAPYTPLHTSAKEKSPSDGMVSVLAGNVLQTNNNYDKFLAIVKKYDPDLVLVMESNKDWKKGLALLEKSHPHTVQIPLENLYGMHLYSKVKLQNVSINYHVEKDIPSIFCEYPINDSNTIFFACLHPAPPSPTENDTSKERDAELMIVGEHIRDLNKPVVVCGDMNDVVWSRTTRLFKKMTDMIDPRVGRGFFPTYHAGYRLMRFPLDHIFHTQDLFIGTMERSENYGSDHFAMYYEIYHKTGAATDTNGEITAEDQEDIDEIIEDGLSA
jgi:endonuclease/exonuclease/phosphatase (EEP) superfamily protein YafD